MNLRLLLHFLHLPDFFETQHCLVMKLSILLADQAGGVGVAPESIQELDFLLVEDFEVLLLLLAFAFLLGLGFFDLALWRLFEALRVDLFLIDD